MRPTWWPSRTLALGFALSAAAAFAVSLGYFVYVFGVSLGAPVPEHASSRITWLDIMGNVTTFSLFALHHSVLARVGVKRWLSRWLPGHLERATYVWVASLLLILVGRSWTRVDGVVWHYSGLAAWLGHGVQALGAAILLRAGSRINLSELAGIRQAVAGANVDPVDGPTPPRLEVGGPYRLVRHPLYLGMLMLTWAIPTMTLDRLVLCACLTAYVLIAVPWEERALTAEFGVAYRRYVARVHWRVMPGIY